MVSARRLFALHERSAHTGVPVTDVLGMVSDARARGRADARGAAAKTRRELLAGAGGLPGDVVISLVDVLAGRTAATTALVRDVAPGVDVIAAARELSGVEMALVGELGRERFLADALAPLKDRYPMIVLDTPPNLGLLTVNALVFADIVLAPVSCEDEASVQGLVELCGTLAKLRRLRDSEPDLLTILTRWAPARVMSQVVEASLDALGLAVIARVPSRAVVGRAGAEHVPLTITSPDGCVALAYERLVDTLTAARLSEPAVIR